MPLKSTLYSRPFRTCIDATLDTVIMPAVLSQRTFAADAGCSILLHSLHTQEFLPSMCLPAVWAIGMPGVLSKRILAAGTGIIWLRAAAAMDGVLTSSW